MPQLPGFWPARHTGVSQSGRGARWAVWEAVMKWSMVTPNPNRNSNPHPSAKGVVSPPLVERSSSWLTCPSTAASNGWPALSGRPCSLLSTVWLSSSQSNIATGYRSPHSHRASFRKKDTHTHVHGQTHKFAHAHTHTHTFHTWHTLSSAHNLSVSLSLAHTSFSKLSHTQSLCLLSHIHTHKQFETNCTKHKHSHTATTWTNKAVFCACYEGEQKTYFDKFTFMVTESFSFKWS